jgi:hypothetical protein
MYETVDVVNLKFLSYICHFVYASCVDALSIHWGSMLFEVLTFPVSYILNLIILSWLIY